MQVKIPIPYQTEEQLNKILRLLAPVVVRVSKPYPTNRGWRVHVTVKLS